MNPNKSLHTPATNFSSHPNIHLLPQTRHRKMGKASYLKKQWKILEVSFGIKSISHGDTGFENFTYGQENFDVILATIARVSKITKFPEFLNKFISSFRIYYLYRKSYVDTFLIIYVLYKFFLEF